MSNWTTSLGPNNSNDSEYIVPIASASKFSLTFSFVYLVYFINTQDPYKKKIRREIKSIIKKNTLTKHLFNEYI